MGEEKMVSVRRQEPSFFILFPIEMGKNVESPFMMFTFHKKEKNVNGA